MNDAKAMRVLKLADRLQHQGPQDLLMTVYLLQQVEARLWAVVGKLSRISKWLVADQRRNWIRVAVEARQVLSPCCGLRWGCQLLEAFRRAEWALQHDCDE